MSLNPIIQDVSQSSQNSQFPNVRVKFYEFKSNNPGLYLKSKQLFTNLSPKPPEFSKVSPNKFI